MKSPPDKKKTSFIYLLMKLLLMVHISSGELIKVKYFLQNRTERTRHFDAGSCDVSRIIWR